MGRAGGLITLFELIVLGVFLKFTQPFRDILLAQNFLRAKTKILELQEQANANAAAIEQSKTFDFQLRWCLVTGSHSLFGNWRSAGHQQG